MTVKRGASASHLLPSHNPPISTHITHYLLLSNAHDHRILTPTIGRYKYAMDRHYYLYILANARHTVLYTGVTGDLLRRVWEHKTKSIKGFTAKYNVDQLVYYEILTSPTEAIAREKQIKSGSRWRKVALIIKANPGWEDLYLRLLN
jgi:putative endonuclease